MERSILKFQSLCPPLFCWFKPRGLSVQIWRPKTGRPDLAEQPWGFVAMSLLFGHLVVGVHAIGALLFGVYIGAP